MNKSVSIDQSIQYAEARAARIDLDNSATIEKVRALQAVYILRCLIPELLTGMCSPREAWGILGEIANKLSILDACNPLWAWLWVRILPD